MNRIKEELQENGIKQSYLSEKFGKIVNLVNDYCNNRAWPSMKFVFKIANVLVINPKDLI